MTETIPVGMLIERFKITAGEMGYIARLVCWELGFKEYTPEQSKLICWEHPETVERYIKAHRLKQARVTPTMFRPTVQEKKTWFDRLDAKVDGDIIIGIVGYGLLIATVVALVRGCS